eukprot:jgi/Tetstr1/447564/TSEL_034943.t1
MITELRRPWCLLNTNGIYVATLAGAGNNYSNPPWPALMPDLVQKLRQSGAAASVVVVAPRWEGKVWHHALTYMAVAKRVVQPSPELFEPGRKTGRGMLGTPR